MESALSVIFLFVRETRPHYMCCEHGIVHTQACALKDHSCLTQTVLYVISGCDPSHYIPVWVIVLPQSNIQKQHYTQTVQNTLVRLLCNTEMLYEQTPHVINVLTCSVCLQTPNWHPWTSARSLTMPSVAKNSINPHIPRSDLLSFNAVCTPKPVFEYFYSTMTRLKCLMFCNIVF